MPTSYQVDPVQRLVHSRSWGTLTDAEVVDLYRRLATEPEFEPTFRQLCDLREVTRLATSTTTLRDLARSSVFAPGARRAFVVGSDVNYGIARMFQTYCELAGLEVNVFRDEPSATAWLGLPDKSAR
jgi:hypothetical protein